METIKLLELCVSALGLVGGFLAYVLGLRIRKEILENNEKFAKEITVVKDSFAAGIKSVHDELIRELGAAITKVSDTATETDRELSDLIAGMSEKILSTVNGKYVRTDLHQQAMASVQERFGSMKELIEVNLEKIESGLDRQILDLKERIFHNGK